MGQYYKIINVDKAQYLSPWDFDNGAKLMEWSYVRNHMVLALLNLLAGEWAGDRVYVVGDYAEDDTPEEPCYEALHALTSELHLGELDEEGYPISLYGYADENFENVSENVSTDLVGYRYIYNHERECYIDLENCPLEWDWYNRETGDAGFSRIAPLPLLIAMGNDRGGGDFHEGNNGYEYVGTWCSSVKNIEVTKELLTGEKYECYVEFAPNFTENDEVIPACEEEERIKAIKAKHEMK